MFLFTQFRSMHQQNLLINTVIFSIFKHFVLRTSKQMHHCFPCGGRPGITNVAFFYFLLQYNELPSVKICHDKLLSEHTKRKLCCLSGTFICIGSVTRQTDWRTNLVCKLLAFCSLCSASSSVGLSG